MYWQKVPLSWREAPAAIALAKALGERDARVYLLDLWEWAAQHGSTHPAGIAPHAFARAAFWHGDESFFFDALRRSGWLREDGEQVTVLSWSEVVSSLHIAQGLTNEQKKKNQAALRAKRYRARHAASRSVTHRHADVTLASRTSNATERDDGRDEVVPDFIIQRETGRIESVTLPSRDRHASLTEREKEREKEDLSTKNLALFENQKGAGESEKSKPRRGRPPKDKSLEAEAERLAEQADADRWMGEARKLTGLDADELRWTRASFLAFRRQRKSRGVEQLLRALEGLQNDLFSKTAGLGWLVSDNGITKGLAKWKKEAATSHPNRNWDDPKANDLDSWL